MTTASAIRNIAIVLSAFGPGYILGIHEYAHMPELTPDTQEVRTVDYRTPSIMHMFVARAEPNKKPGPTPGISLAIMYGRSHTQKFPKPKSVWTCSNWRPLEQGSGNVKICEYR